MSSGIKTIYDKINADTILTTAGQTGLLDLITYTFMKDYPRNSAVEGLAMVGTTTPSPIDLKTIATDVLDKDMFAIQTDSSILPSIMQFIFLLCKRVVIAHISCRLGIASTSNCKEFDQAMHKACNTHITAIAQTVQSRVPFNPAATETLEAHLDACKAEIKRYVDTTTAFATSSGGEEAVNLAVTASQTAAIFNAQCQPSLTYIIFNMLKPWLTLLYVASFVNNRKPTKFANLWAAQYIILVSGYIIANTCKTSLTSEAHKTKYNDVMKSIATHVNVLVDSQDRLKALYSKSILVLTANLEDSKKLNDNGGNLEFRRKNMESMGARYLSNKAAATSAQRTFYASVVVYAAVTVAVTLMMVSRKFAPYAILVSGLIMVVIIVYALVAQLRSK